MDLDITTTNISKQLGMFGSRLLVFGIAILLSSVTLLIKPSIVTTYITWIDSPDQIAKVKYASYDVGLELTVE